MNRAEILSAAHDCVMRDRAATHGDAERNFGRIAAYWSAHLDHQVSATDVAAMMALMKLARIAGNPEHADSWVDGAGYLACGGEIATGATAAPAPDWRDWLENGGLPEGDPRDAIRRIHPGQAGAGAGMGGGAVVAPPHFHGGRDDMRGARELRQLPADRADRRRSGCDGAQHSRGEP